MQRRTFLTGLAGASIFTAMDGFSTIVNALGATRPQPASERFATFGAVHLNVTSIERAIGFWTRIGGMKLRSSGPDRAELGSEQHTLVVVHQTAPQLRLRRGRAVLCIFNLAFQPAGRPTGTATAAPDVERTVREEDRK